MSLNLLNLLRLLQALLSLLTLILAAIPINFIDTHLQLPPVPAALIFITFTTVFTLLLALPYLVWAPRYFPSITHRYISLAVEFVTMIFWFAGFVSSAVFIGELGFCRGSVCGALKAAVVLGAFGWVSWCISLVFPIKYCFFEREPEMIAMSGGATVVKENDASKWRLRREGLRKEIDVGEMGEVQRSSFEDDDDADVGFVERSVFRLKRIVAKTTGKGSARGRGTVGAGDEVDGRGFHGSGIGEPFTPTSSVQRPRV